MIFTSESVSAGHPDKVCDQISDAILDAALRQDTNSRVAVETLVKDNQVVLAGEITTNAQIDYDEIVKLGGDVGILTNVLCHEFIHYVDHLDLESQGKDFNEVYGNRQDFYETRATDIGGKDNKKLLKKYMKNGSL